MTDQCGIYFLFKRKELIYIGRTTHFPARVKTHKKDFDRIRFIPCSKDLLGHYEQRLIRYFKPELNINSKILTSKSLIPVSVHLMEDIRSLSQLENRMFTRQIEYMLLTYIRERKKEKKFSKVLKSA